MGSIIFESYLNKTVFNHNKMLGIANAIFQLVHVPMGTSYLFVDILVVVPRLDELDFVNGKNHFGQYFTEIDLPKLPDVL